MDSVEFQCTVTPDGYVEGQPDLVFGINLNGVTKFVQFISDKTVVKFDIPDVEDQEHTIEFVLAGKTANHTILDQNGNTELDAKLIVSDITVDEIDIDSVIQTKSLPYKHDFNGTGEETVDDFYDLLGCNGTATFTFTTPFYLWLLENM